MKLVIDPSPFNGYLTMLLFYMSFKTNGKKNILLWNVTHALSKFTDVPLQLR
jgi:hypothetical protein